MIKVSSHSVFFHNLSPTLNRIGFCHPSNLWANLTGAHVMLLVALLCKLSLTANTALKAFGLHSVCSSIGDLVGTSLMSTNWKCIVGSQKYTILIISDIPILASLLLQTAKRIESGHLILFYWSSIYVRMAIHIVQFIQYTEPFAWGRYAEVTQCIVLVT